MLSNVPVSRQASLWSPLLIGVLLFAVACGGGQATEEEAITEEAPREHRARWGNLDRGGTRQETADLDGNGTPDQYSYYDGSRLVWAERDFDFDGRRELYEYYGPSGDVIEQEFQLDFDDAIDVVRFFEGGRLVRKEMSTDFSGHASLVKFYDISGNLLRIERDNTGDGVTDIWEYFENGQLSYIGTDADGDGTPETLQSPTE